MEQYYQLNFTIVKNIVDYKNIISYNIFYESRKTKTTHPTREKIC